MQETALNINSISLLWIPDSSKALHFGRYFNELENDLGISIKSINQIEKIDAELQRHSIQCVIWSLESHIDSTLTYMRRLKKKFPLVTQIAVLSGSADLQIESLINDSLAFKILSQEDSYQYVRASILDALAQFNQQVERRKLLDQVRDQNRHLEETRANLEKSVYERTKSEQDSKSEIEAKVLRMRELVRFVKDLAVAVTAEELVFLLRKEIRRFHQVREPCLSLITNAKKAVHFYFRGSHFKQKAAIQSWIDGVRIRINDPEDSLYLANEFGRPFGKVIAFPILLGKQQSETSKVSAILFFEHALSDGETEEFLNFVSERLQSLSLALDRILLEQELRNSSHLWAHTFDGIRDPVAILDLEYNLLRANRQFAEASGSHKCHKLFAEREVPCVGCPLPQALQSGKPEVGQVQRGDRVFEVHSYPIYFAREDRVTTVVNHYLDVTVAHDLQSRMVQNEKMVALGHLAGHIAHELNNPLTGVRALAQLCLNELSPQSQIYQDLKEVEAASQRCQSIIQNLLQFTSGGDKKLRVSLKEVISSTLPFLKTALGDHDVEIDFSPGQDWIEVEPHLLQQVVFNILNNACQAMPSRGQIHIKSGVEGKQIYFSVKDSGIGIAAKNIERVFEPFFTTKKEGEGTGLGLSMSRQIVRSFGGDILVKSAEGQGTEFKVYLPMGPEQ